MQMRLICSLIRACARISRGNTRARTDTPCVQDHNLKYIEHLSQRRRLVKAEECKALVARNREIAIIGIASHNFVCPPSTQSTRFDGWLAIYANDQRDHHYHLFAVSLGLFLGFVSLHRLRFSFFLSFDSSNASLSSFERFCLTNFAQFSTLCIKCAQII